MIAVFIAGLVFGAALTFAVVDIFRPRSPFKERDRGP